MLPPGRCTALSPRTPAAEALQLGLLRSRNAREKLSQVRSLSQLVVGLSRRGVRRVNPGKTPAELDSLFIRLHCGGSIAQRVADYRQRRGM